MIKPISDIFVKQALRVSRVSLTPVSKSSIVTADFRQSGGVMAIGISIEEEKEFEIDYAMRNEDIKVREMKEFGRCKNQPTLTKPHLTSASVLTNYTWMVKYYGSREVERTGFIRPQQIYLFPLIPPKIPEIEYSGPPEWMVICMGTVQEILESPLSEAYEPLRKLSPQRQIVIMNVRNPETTGLRGQLMWKSHYVGEAVTRVITGYSDTEDEEGKKVFGDHLVFPKMYLPS
jgi:hypothetical protein